MTEEEKKKAAVLKAKYKEIAAKRKLNIERKKQGLPKLRKN